MVNIPKRGHLHRNPSLIEACGYASQSLLTKRILIPFVLNRIGRECNPRTIVLQKHTSMHKGRRKEKFSFCVRSLGRFGHNPSLPLPSVIHYSLQSSTLNMRLLRNSTLLIALLHVLLASCALSQDYTFNGNTTVADPDGTLGYRETLLVTFLGGTTAGFRSVSYHRSEKVAEADTIGGVISWDRVPTAFLSYFALNATWEENSFNVSGGTIINSSIVATDASTRTGH